MKAQKISVSLPEPVYEFMEEYQKMQHCKTRSQVIVTALLLLQQKLLEQYYEEANQEVDSAFDMTAGDGLEDDETW